jgi:hypothetical protein
MDVSDASFYISNEKKKNKGSQMGHTKKNFFLKVSDIFNMLNGSSLKQFFLYLFCSFKNNAKTINLNDPLPWIGQLPKAGFPTWKKRPPGGTQEVSLQWYLWYICISGGTQQMLGDADTKRLGTPDLKHDVRRHIFDCFMINSVNFIINMQQKKF